MNTTNTADKTRMLNLDQIDCNSGTQIRQSINEDTVNEYAEAMRNGVDFPEAIVFYDEDKYILADGFHRCLARQRAGFTDIKVEVRPGTRVDALRCALGANANHGLRRTNADKRRAVEIALAEWPDLSDRQIADLCAVSHEFVRLVRTEQVSTVDTCGSITRLGADGKRYTRKQNTAAAKRNPSPRSSALGALGSTRRAVQSSCCSISGRPVNDNLKSEARQHLESAKDAVGSLLKELDNDPLQSSALRHSQITLRTASAKADLLLRKLLLPR